MAHLQHPRERFELVFKVGRGAFGFVWRAWDRAKDEEVAIKIVSIGEDLDAVNEEIRVMSQVDCPQLVKYYGSYVVEDTLWIAMAFFDCGSLTGSCLLLSSFGEIQPPLTPFPPSLPQN
jgi:serine/threonine protein kinase